jgi:hypothetical protein
LEVFALEEREDSRVLLDKEGIRVDHEDVVPEDNALIRDGIIVGGDVDDFVRAKRANANRLDALLRLLWL